MEPIAVNLRNDRSRCIETTFLKWVRLGGAPGFYPLGSTLREISLKLAKVVSFLLVETADLIWCLVFLYPLKNRLKQKKCAR